MIPLKRQNRRVQRRYDRRVGRTPVVGASVPDILRSMSQMRMDVDNRLPAGSYYVDERKIVQYPGSGEDVLEHEKIHASQHNILNRLRVQDPEIRRASRRLNRSITDEQIQSLDEPGKYIIQPHEFEAHIRAAKPRIMEMGLSTDSFDDMLKGLQIADREGTGNKNMRNLMLFMQNDWTPEQKNNIMSAMNYSGI